MCGIAGIIRSDGRFRISDVEAVLRMMDAQTHRGPDDWGLLLPHTACDDESIRPFLLERGLLTESQIRTPTSAIRHPQSDIRNPQSAIRNSPDSHLRIYQARQSSPAVILGSRRLSILDLSARGRMPMGNENEKLWITHNGEIYNCPELRDELRHEFTFHSGTDTEVLLKGYQRWGDGVLDHLRGMFAFALFDVDKQRLLLARDRFGIKPIYYSKISDFGFRIADFEAANHESSNPNPGPLSAERNAGKPQSEIRNPKSEILVFASEVRAIVSSGLVPLEREPEAVVRFLQLGSVPAPLTTVKNVFALPAGHSLVVEGGHTRVSRYWDLTESKQTTEVERRAAVETTRRLLEESVHQHLLSDVPLGIFLSGGIDSSALVAVAQKFREQPLTTLSIVFDEPEYNEAKYARLVANRYESVHHEVLLQGGELFSELPQVFAAMDQPTIDGVNSFFISRAAKQAGLKVVLSGLGGDELFLGYNHLRNAESLNISRRMFETLPGTLRQAAIKLAIPAGGFLGRSGLEKLDYLRDPSPEGMYLLFRGLFTPGQIQKLLGLSDSELKQYGVVPPSINGSKADSLTDSFVLNDFQHYLQNQLLKDTDCMSMAHSIETRVPFLDHELVSYVFGLPGKFKVAKDMNKPLLVDALGDDFPREIWDRPKMGFTFPFADWLGQSNDDFQETGTSGQFFDKAEADKVWQGFREGKLHWSRPWALTALTHHLSG